MAPAMFNFYRAAFNFTTSHAMCPKSEMIIRPRAALAKDPLRIGLNLILWNYILGGLKGQPNSKWFFWADVSSNKQTDKFNFTIFLTFFLFVFWKKVKIPKRHFEINLPLEGPQGQPLGGILESWCFMILKILHQNFLIKGSNFVLSPLDDNHWVAQTWTFFDILLIL